MIFVLELVKIMTNDNQEPAAAVDVQIETEKDKAIEDEITKTQHSVKVVRILMIRCYFSRLNCKTKRLIG